MKMNLRKIAQHECCHALAAWRLGYILIGVTIENGALTKKRDDIGTPFHCRLMLPPWKQKYFDTFDVLVYAYPGVMEKEFFNSVSEGTFLNCTEAANAMLRQKKEFEPYYKAAARAAKKAVDPVKRGKIFFQNIHKTIEDRIVFDSKAKRVVRALSRVLLKNKTLSGQECAYIFERVYGIPGGVLPAAEHYSMLGAKTEAGRLGWAEKSLSLILAEITSCEDNELLNRAREKILEARFLIGVKG